MATAYFASVFFSVCSGTIFTNQPESTLKFYETNTHTAALQRRDSIGGWLHHLHRSVAVRSDAWVMVQVSRNRLAPQ